MGQYGRLPLATAGLLVS